MGCGGCGGCGGILGPLGKHISVFGGPQKKEAFEGLPYDSRTYYAGGLAGQVEHVRSGLKIAVMAGGIQNVKVKNWEITMSKLFSAEREYLVVHYGGIQVYLLIIDFGSDLYASWISFFNLGCLDRLKRFGSSEPTVLDVDDLEMAGMGIDFYLRDTLDRILRGAGVQQQKVDKIFAGVRRKRFVKT